MEFGEYSSNTKQIFRGKTSYIYLGLDFDLHAICLSVKQWEKCNIRSKNFLVSILQFFQMLLYFLEPIS